jgi:hypothetical protein
MSYDTASTSIAHLQSSFMSALWPTIMRVGRAFFRKFKPDHREEALAEMVGICWSWFLSLVGKGKDPTKFPVILSYFAARRVKAGRRFCGRGRCQDVLSHQIQQRHGFTVESLPQSEGGPEDRGRPDDDRPSRQPVHAAAGAGCFSCGFSGLAGDPNEAASSGYQEFDDRGAD